MKPPPFEYTAPESLEDALEVVAKSGPDAKLLAGGQSLVPLMNLRLAAPDHLIDLNPVEGLDGIRASGGGLSVGAMTRQSAVESSALVHETKEIGERPPGLDEPVCGFAIDGERVDALPLSPDRVLRSIGRIPN